MISSTLSSVFSASVPERKKQTYMSLKHMEFNIGHWIQVMEKLESQAGH